MGWTRRANTSSTHFLKRQAVNVHTTFFSVFFFLLKNVAFSFRQLVIVFPGMLPARAGPELERAKRSLRPQGSFAVFSHVLSSLSFIFSV